MLWAPQIPLVLLHLSAEHVAVVTSPLCSFYLPSPANAPLSIERCWPNRDLGSQFWFLARFWPMDFITGIALQKVMCRAGLSAKVFSLRNKHRIQFSLRCCLIPCRLPLAGLPAPNDFFFFLGPFPGTKKKGDEYFNNEFEISALASFAPGCRMPQHSGKNVNKKVFK